MMKFLCSLVAVTALACMLPAQAATTDPEIIIYRASGVIDTGSASGAGVATVFQCTNVSTVSENLRFVIRNFNSIIVANQVFTVPSFFSQTASTHFTNLYVNATLAPGTSINGTVAIAATTPNMFCTARTVDASASVPSGIILPMVRFNPMAGSEE
jgi:hypothetical protein